MKIIRLTIALLIARESLARTYTSALESNNRHPEIKKRQLNAKGKGKDEKPCFVCPEDKKEMKDKVKDKDKCKIRDECPQSCVIDECEYSCHENKEIWVEDCPDNGEGKGKGKKDDEDEKFEIEENDASEIIDNVEGSTERGAPETTNESNGMDSDVNSEGNDENGDNTINGGDGMETDVDSSAVRWHIWASAYVVGAIGVNLF